jgi:aminoglycoside phosphotransferase (APT) family kinase protein
MDDLISGLQKTVPASTDATVVHGDFRLDNLLVDDGDLVTAVLDWEMSTLGDPLTDVAVLLAYQQLAEVSPPAREGAALVTDAPLAPGYLGRDELLARYQSLSGRDLTQMPFHLGLAFFKLAVILEGIHFRHSRGQTVGAGFDGIGDMIGPLIAAGRAASR